MQQRAIQRMAAEVNLEGPASMTLNMGKAGMETVDKAKVNEIIMNASKGSKYYARQQERQLDIEQRIKAMKSRLENITEEQLITAQEKMNRLAAELENRRDLSRVMVHIDMDAYFAAVEMRDEPHLTNVPMAVGGMSMLSTSNYHARKFGVRAAMPGFIAKKLCPELVIVKPNYDKYTQVSGEVREVIAQYDPNFSPTSLDEAYLEITDLVDNRFALDCDKSREEISNEIVDEIRQKIFQRTNLTCSAGIAANSRLAKVGSNINKPNGQFCIPFSREEMMKFVSTLPIAKICGIGNVSEQMLNALDVKLCKDLWDKRATISLLFSDISTETYLSISLGLGSTRVHTDDNRKSISVERTFGDTSDVAELKKKCRRLSDHLSEDLKNEEVLGKVVTLKIKTSCYHVKTRAQTLAFYTNNAEHIGTAAEKLLEQEIKSAHPQLLVLRLMGVRMASLVDKSTVPKQQQQTLENVLKNRIQLAEVLSSDSEAEAVSRNNNDIFHDDESSTVSSSGFNSRVSTTSWTCPVCNRLRVDDDPEVQNRHIDECLTKQTVKEVLKEENTASPNVGNKRSATPSGIRNGIKRKKIFGKTIDDYFKRDN